jgi:hypothetical protein
MIRRIAYIENQKTLSDSGDYTTSISVRDPITALYIQLNAMNGSTSNKANLLPYCVDTVDLVDGSDVIASMDGLELFVVGSYKLGHIPYQWITEKPSEVQSFYMPILFGRWLGDTDLAFDPTKFNNPQLRIKWNLAAVRAVGATGFATGTGQLTVLADIMEGVGSPTGYLSHKEHFSFTTAASGTQYIDLPTDKPIKCIYFLSHKATVGKLSGISKIKVHCEQGKYLLYDIYSDDLKKLESVFTKLFSYKHRIYAKNTDVFYSILKQDEVVNIQGEGNDITVSYSDTGIGEGALSVYSAGSASASELVLNGLVSGWLPFGGIRIPFGDQDEPNTWLNASNYKSIRMETDMNAAGAAAELVLEQLTMY